MEIDRLGQSQIPPQSQRIRQAQEAARQRSSSEISHSQQGQDQVTISEQGQMLHRVYRAALEAVDVREDRVAELRRRIAEGSYQVPLPQLVDRLLGAE